MTLRQFPVRHRAAGLQGSSRDSDEALTISRFCYRAVSFTDSTIEESDRFRSWVKHQPEVPVEGPYMSWLNTLIHWRAGALS